jgi:hypothetical protein
MSSSGRDFPRSIVCACALALALGLAGPAASTNIINIDDFESGAISVSSQNNVGDSQVETGLPSSSVVAGYRRTDLTASGTSPTTITSVSGRAEIVFPTVIAGNFIFFIYNNGDTSFPSTGINLDLSQIIAFHLDFPEVDTSRSVQITLFSTKRIGERSGLSRSENLPL